MTEESSERGRLITKFGDRAASRLAWALFVLCVVYLAAGVVLLVLYGNYSSGSTWGTANLNFIFPVVILAFALVGALVASRLPANPIGWICLVIGLVLSLAAATGEYNVFALRTRPGSLPGGEYMAWLTNWLWVPAVVLIGTFLVLLFPDGRLPSRRWRALAWLSGGVLISAIASEALSPGRLAEAPHVTNPFGIESASGLLEVTNTVAFMLLPVCFLLSALSMIGRFRRSTGVERQQIKWFATAAALLAALFSASFVASSGFVEDLVTLMFAGLPVAVGFAILRHRLYDIDVLINRALVYGFVTATLALVYAGSVVSLQYALRFLTGQESTLAVVASTLAIAVLFSPLRRRVQALVDRRFYRRKYDARKTLGAFSVRLRDETDLGTLRKDLVGVVSSTVQPEHVSLWLRPEATRKGEQAN